MGEEDWLKEITRKHPWRMRWAELCLSVELCPVWLWIMDIPMADGYRYRTKKPNPEETDW